VAASLPGFDRGQPRPRLSCSAIGRQARAASLGLTDLQARPTILRYQTVWLWAIRPRSIVHAQAGASPREPPSTIT